MKSKSLLSTLRSRKPNKVQGGPGDELVDGTKEIGNEREETKNLSQPRNTRFEGSGESEVDETDSQSDENDEYDTADGVNKDEQTQHDLATNITPGLTKQFALLYNSRGAGEKLSDWKHKHKNMVRFSFLGHC